MKWTRLVFPAAVALAWLVSCSGSSVGKKCTADAECGGEMKCLCFAHYQAYTGKSGTGPICTIACKTDADCESRFPGTKCFGSYADQGCGGSSVCYKSATAMTPGDLCVYATAKCFPDICDGCTAGGYGKCPPKDTDYTETCGIGTVDSCKKYAVAPEVVSPSSSLLRYTKDVRLLRGIATCADYRANGEGSATSIERYCTGACM